MHLPHIYPCDLSYLQVSKVIFPEHIPHVYSSTLRPVGCLHRLIQYPFFRETPIEIPYEESSCQYEQIIDDIHSVLGCGSNVYLNHPSGQEKLCMHKKFICNNETEDVLVREHFNLMEFCTVCDDTKYVQPMFYNGSLKLVHDNSIYQTTYKEMQDLYYRWVDQEIINNTLSNDIWQITTPDYICLLYTSDSADDTP